MEVLSNLIVDLKRTKIKDLVDTCLQEFSKKRSEKELFSELCFCILTANFNAERTIKIQKEIDKGFSNLPKSKLAKKLKQLGHRFPNARADYIVSARKHRLQMDRDWLVKNVKGLGYKEASHFLRNIGYTDFAIVDFHIVDLLVANKIIKEPKTLTKNNYLHIENKLKKLSQKVNLNLAELDLYLWYLETGKVLK